MDKLELLKLGLGFIEKIVASLAWPVVAVLIAVMFKDKLTKLLEELIEWKGLGVEAKFARGVKEALAEVQVLEATEPAETPPGTDDVDAALQIEDPDFPKITPVNMLLVTANPKAAVMLGRSNIETAAKFLATRAGISDSESRTLVGALQALERNNIISTHVFQMASELRTLGNGANHGQFEPSVEAARDFALATNKLVAMLLNAGRVRYSPVR